MAIDTRNKRASAQSVYGIMLVLPTPDASVDAEDRAQVTWLYAGFIYLSPAVIRVSRRGFEIELYDKYGDLKKVLTKNAVVQSWEYLRTGGCGQCDVATTFVPFGLFDTALLPGDNIKLRIRDEVRYAGKLIKIARNIGSGRDGVGLTFYGYSTELRDPIIKETYEGMEVSEIIKQILDEKIVGSTRITYVDAEIEPTDYVVASVSLNHSVIDAIAFLAGLAGDVEWGVDRNLKFYFRRKDAVVRRAFIIGKHVKEYAEIEDHEAVKNKVFVYGVDASDALATLSAGASVRKFGTRESNLFASSISESSDANRLGLVTLKNQASKQRQIKFTMQRDDYFLESSHPLGASSIVREPIPSLKKYGHTYRYGTANKYGNLKRDQVNSIRYSMIGGGLLMEIVLTDDVPNSGDQQKRVENEIKELQRR